MFPKSIRWRLPLSYAGIALLAALALGLVLLTTLRSYYRERELDYLYNNARVVSYFASRLLKQNLPQDALQVRLESFSFLSQTRVQLLNTDNQVLVDSGVPQADRPVSISFAPENSAPLDGQINVQGKEWLWSVSVEAAATAGTPLTDCEILSNDPPRQDCLNFKDEAFPVASVGAEQDRFFTVSVMPSMFGFGLNGNKRFENYRSDQAVETPVVDRERSVIGYVRLSDGPIYGAEIVSGVARGWLVASSIAVLLAAGVGWLISRWMSQPLLSLTRVTSRMAHGELSARASIRQDDEFGTLGRAFNDMAAKVEETVVVLRRFVADAAHEIHTPLTALRTNLELALTGDSSTGAFLERALGQVKRLEMLTDGLLQLSRLETAPTNVTPEAVNLALLVREMSEFYASQAEQAGQTFNLELPDAPVLVNLNPIQFRSALSNLLENAIKFTPENGTITLRMGLDGGYVRLWVQDTGIGIPADDLPLVFNRFHRGRNASAYAGSGLGLAIVRAVMDRQRGQVTVDSSPQGTQFMLQLPVAGH